MAWKICDYGGFELISRKLRANVPMNEKAQTQDADRMHREDNVSLLVILRHRNLFAGNQSQQGLRAYFTNPFICMLSEGLYKPGCRLYKLSHFSKGFQSDP